MNEMNEIWNEEHDDFWQDDNREYSEWDEIERLKQKFDFTHLDYLRGKNG